MATVNPFDLLGDDIEDPSQLIAAQQQKVPAQAKKTPAPAATQQPAAAKLPSKPLPPAQAVRESKAEGERGGGYGRGRGGGYGRGHGGSGFNNRESTNTDNAFGNRDFSRSRGTVEDADSTKPSESRGVIGGPRTTPRGGRRGGFSNGEASDGEPPRRVFERRSGTGRGNEMKREGAGRGNWGTPTDDLSEVVDEVVNEGEKIPSTEKTDSVEADTTEGNKDIPATETEEKEPEIKEMTLEEYEKVLEEKRKALQSLKTEERKVDDKEFASMQQLTNKKTSGDDIFIKLGSDKDKKKENAEKEERAKKALSINEFLKPAEGERYYSPGSGRGRGGGRGRAGGRGGGGYGGGGENPTRNIAEAAPAIEDPGQFPSLTSK